MDPMNPTNWNVDFLRNVLNERPANGMRSWNIRMERFFTLRHAAAADRYLYENSDFYKKLESTKSEIAKISSILFEIRRGLYDILWYPELSDNLLSIFYKEQYEYYKKMHFGFTNSKNPIMDIVKSNVDQRFRLEIPQQRQLQEANVYLREYQIIENQVPAKKYEEITETDVTLLLNITDCKIKLEERAKSLAIESEQYQCVICQENLNVVENKESVSCRICIQRLGHFDCIEKMFTEFKPRCPFYNRCVWRTKEKPLACSSTLEEILKQLI